MLLLEANCAASVRDAFGVFRGTEVRTCASKIAQNVSLLSEISTSSASPSAPNLPDGKDEVSLRRDREFAKHTHIGYKPNGRSPGIIIHVNRSSEPRACKVYTGL